MAFINYYILSVKSPQTIEIALAIDEPLEYLRSYLEGNMQMWIDAEDSLELW